MTVSGAALLLFLAVQAPGDSLTLAAAMARARAARAQGAIAAAQVAEARGALRTAGMIPNPTVSYSHSEATPLNHLLVDQPFDWLLRRGADRSAARAGVARARADSTQTMLDLDHAVRLAYWRTRAALLSQALVEAQAVQADSLSQIAAARFRAGDISLLEQEQAGQEAARARQTVSSAREVAGVAVAGLVRAVGAESPPPPPSDPLDAGLDALPDSTLTLADVPLLRAAVADSVAAAAQIRSATKARLPIPSLQAGTEWGDPSEPGALTVIGFAVPLPLWNRSGGTVAEARARAERLSAVAREARLDVARQVREARIHLQETARRARSARDSLIPAAAALRSRALRAYRAGETGILPVLDAFRAERDVALAGLQDQLAFQEAVADWYALTSTGL
jgi:cobalt-zinc-cadmium efflux system outer membrane protein